MTLEDLAFDLGDMRELTRTHGIKRQKHLRPLMQISGDFELPETRRWERAKLIAVAISVACMLALVVAMLIDRSGGEATKFGKICLLAGYFAFLIAAAAAVFAAAMQRRARVKTLTALSEALNARASELDEAEFDAICRSMIYVPESLFEEEKPVNLCCGCVRCAKMLPADGECCPECGNARLIYGDSECPLDEARLQRIHNLLL